MQVGRYPATNTTPRHSAADSGGMVHFSRNGRRGDRRAQPLLLSLPLHLLPPPRPSEHEERLAEHPERQKRRLRRREAGRRAESDTMSGGLSHEAGSSDPRQNRIHASFQAPPQAAARVCPLHRFSSSGNTHQAPETRVHKRERPEEVAQAPAAVEPLRHAEEAGGEGPHLGRPDRHPASWRSGAAARRRRVRHPRVRAWRRGKHGQAPMLAVHGASVSLPAGPSRCWLPPKEILPPRSLTRSRRGCGW